MHKGFEKYWSKFKKRFKLLLSASIVLPLLAGVVLLLSISNIAHLTIPFAFWVVYIISISSLLLIWNSKLFWDNQKLIRFLHQRYPEMEYSLTVFFKNDINSLEKIQQAKIFEQLPSIQKIVFPISLRKAFISLVFSGLLYFASFNYQMQNPYGKQLTSIENKAEVTVDSANQNAIGNFAYQLKVYPPSYTALRSFEWQANKKIPEGSRLVFTNKGNIHFDLLWQNQYEFKLVENQSKSFVLNQSSIFQINYKKNASSVSLKPEILEMKRDEAPILSTNLKDNRHEISWGDLDKDFKLELNLEDDYGIVSTDIIMTLSRGEGESVRFREMKQAISGISKQLRRQQKNVSLPLDTFSLEPGDELYFYFSAKDNKKPKANTGKTDVYFISIADTVESDPVEYEGFALTSEAEYFKSQRQIIIDTEKLLADQNQITEDEFEQRSNSIGADQKLLRLRYGVFLGEEFETTGGLGEVDHTGHDHGDIEGEDEEHEGHDHEDHESESNFSNPIYNETPELKAYVHAHDESELSTFLDANVKSKLKAALTNMWEAELYLRTYKPKDALPFEYEALKLIKEVKRASRIYVERMGFEPPPIDEEKKRLTGELDKIDAQTTDEELGEESFEGKLAETYSELKAAYQKGDMNKAEAVIDKFTNDLVSKITSEPVRFGSLLSTIKQFQNTKLKSKLGTILIIMEDMLPVSVLKNADDDKSIKTSLHKTYYDLLNE